MALDQTEPSRKLRHVCYGHPSADSVGSENPDGLIIDGKIHTIFPAVVAVWWGHAVARLSEVAPKTGQG